MPSASQACPRLRPWSVALPRFFSPDFDGPFSNTRPLLFGPFAGDVLLHFPVLKGWPWGLVFARSELVFGCSGLSPWFCQSSGKAFSYRCQTGRFWPLHDSVLCRLPAPCRRVSPRTSFLYGLNLSLATGPRSLAYGPFPATRGLLYIKKID